MNITITNGAIEFGAETIIEEINFEINNKDKIAVVGRNGAGKSTLLRSIINNEMLTEGIGEEKFNIKKEGSPVIGYLKQIEFEDDTISMIDEILKVYKPILDLENKIQILLNKMQTDKSEQLSKEYIQAMDRYEFLDGYTYKKEYETMINKFGFTKEDKQKKISEFSGGQRTKIAFIKLLLSKPDILLLDEPTNHLDVTTIKWLEGYLKNYPKAVVIVSHDRMFLDKIVNKVYEIEYATLTKYVGNYTDFERLKKANYEKQLKDYEYQQAEIKRLKQIADKFRYKPTKAKMAMSKLKQIEHMVMVKEPSKYDLTSFKTNFTIEKESGNDVLNVKDLEIGYEGKVLQKLSFSLYKGQKLGIIGENGIGKSTLLKTLSGKIEKISGNFSFGYNVKIGYFDQQMNFKDNEKTVFDDFLDEFPKLTTTEIRNSLASFLFYGDDVFKKISMLSGGEKVRLQLAKILKKGPNLLILDEPTNHMDIVGKESLELLLKEYKGTVLFVSHDRFFINKIADSLMIFSKNGVKFFDGKYEDYEENEIEEENIPVKKEEQNIKEKKGENLYIKQKENAKREARIKKLEREIEELENINAKNKELLQNEEVYTNYEKLTEIQNEIESINKKIENYMEEWEKLMEI
mgnify:CR=1 FL=1